MRRDDLLTSIRVGLLITVAVTMSACATRIYNKNETIQPSKVPFSKFTNVVELPLVVERSEDDAGDRRAVEYIRGNLRKCFDSVFKVVTPAMPEQKNFAAGTLVIEPAIEDLKKITVGERVMVGAIAGSSAVLLRTLYRDGASGEVIASPVFYAKGSARGFGVMDNAMLTRVVDLACDYAHQNQ